jgi:trehalose-6-phosphatase
MSRWNNKIVIFDLDGTLADISVRRNLATKDNGKLDWDIFLNRDNIKLDVPNQKVVDMARMINDTDRYQIWILSGRTKATYRTTQQWLIENDIPFDHLMMRPTDNHHHYKKDSDLKEMWLNEIGVNNVAMVFDDRQQVVDMWRQNGLTCFQVADGDF